MQSVKELADLRGVLAQQAIGQFRLEIDAIIQEKCLDSNRIEYTLDRVLDFCFDPGILSLYKKLCRYYFPLNPLATASYIDAYREFWD